ncbi:MAG: phosphoribosylanthranilate isomerase [Lachnospiraceae bacterium]|nr:phosphoribosylanthranilate isomerase [Ruminococcus sp.]MCM1273824.1 phosphoribosylanthranilate isomerase [Lachnospiraceae bacterium]
MSAKIKLCGMFRDCDIDYVNEAMPDYVGFIVMFPKSHRNIDLETALRLKSRLSPEIKSVAVSVNAPVGQLAEFAKSGAADILQCHGNEDADYIAKLRELTGVPIIKAVKVTSAADIENAQRLGADYLLLDSGTGSGRLFDHSLIDPGKIRVPFFLAGGLTPENLAQAVREVRPYAVDLSSGVETNKLKDREKILAAVREARK